MPIRPTTYGHDLDLPRDNGHVQLYRITRGQEQVAMKAVLNDRRRGRLTDHEAALLLCGLNQITLSRPQPVKSRRSLAAAFVARLERLFVKVMRFDEAEELCRGK